MDLNYHYISTKLEIKSSPNYQRISIIILFYKSGKSIRDFIDDNLSESKWLLSWIKENSKEKHFYDWLKMFDMKTIRKIGKVLLPRLS